VAGDPRGGFDRILSLSKYRHVPLLCLLLTAAAVIVFGQVIRCDFTIFDDDVYVTDNMHIRHGVSMEAIRWAFTTGYAANWHPLTWISHMLDIQFFGFIPRWHHLTNLLLHIANTLLLFFVLNRMTQAPWKSAMVAVLFAIHPLHVESVAWVAERKDVLSTFFWMLTMAAYVSYVEHLPSPQCSPPPSPTGREREDGNEIVAPPPSLFSPWGEARVRGSLVKYLLVVLFFAIGLMAKPMLVTLPFVLLLLDYWPLQRLQAVGNADQEAGRENQKLDPDRKPFDANKRKKQRGKESAGLPVSAVCSAASPGRCLPVSVSIRPLLLEKIPFFALAALSCAVTFIIQQKGGAVGSFEAFPPGVRVSNALVSYIVYVEKTVWPSGLALYYSYTRSWPLLPVLGSALVLIAVTVTVIRTAKKSPYLATGWLWFAGTLVPVIGIVQVGGQAMADRYTYVPLIGLFIIAAWGIPDLWRKWRFRNEVLSVISIAVIVCLMIAAYRQVEYWRNSIELFDHALDVTGDNVSMLNNRGLAYVRLGNLRHAVSDFDRAIEIDFRYADAYNNRGIVYGKLGDHPQAISDYARAIEINPGNPDVYVNRGIEYGKIGDHLKAIEDFGKAIEIGPSHVEAYFNRCVANDKLGNHLQAIQDCDIAIEMDPAHLEAYFNRGVAYGEIGDHGQAIENFDKVIEIDPEDGRAYFNRAVAFDEIGNHRRAIEDLKSAARFGSEEARGFLRNQGMDW